MYRKSGVRMTVDFYTITDASNVVFKTVPAESKVSVQNVDIIRPSSMEDPQIVLVSFTGMLSKNYCYVSKFDRWYFINRITVSTAQRVIMDLSVDVLYTYRASIGSCLGTAIRSESIGVNKIRDNKYPLDDNKYIIDAINYPDTPFTRSATMGYILTTIGGTS